LAALILLAVVALLPLGLVLRRGAAGRGRREAALALHRAQLAELERDRVEGRIAAADHATAVLEVQRRLLAADALPEAAIPSTRRWPILAAMVVVPVAAFALYSLQGRPGLPGAPMAARLAGADRAAHDTAMLIAMLRAKLAEPGLDPEKARQGYLYLGNAEDSLGHLREAAAAWRQAVRLRFDPALAALAAEAQTRVDDGHVSPDSAALFTEALAQAPADAPWRGIAERRLKTTKAAP
jgi:cytochrome c-type biogenesis protein CcmH